MDRFPSRYVSLDYPDGRMRTSKLLFLTFRRVTDTTLIALSVATIGIIIRSSYRIVELQAGFHSDVFNNEPLFMVLEGTVMSIVALSLTLFHPGLVFRQQWRDADYVFRTSRISRRKD